MTVYSSKFPILSVKTITSKLLVERPSTVLILTVGWSQWDSDLIKYLESTSLNSANVLHLDLDELTDYEEIKRYFPMLPLPLETPCLALFKGQYLTAFLIGKDALLYSKAKWKSA